ncbi:MAG: anti-sigma factor [Actinomycetota bacterium]|nr:anti-sigma factor [Actinomycetota bacterium]
MGDLSHKEAAELLGAYALDAVDGDERAALERHLRECRPCQNELTEHREVVAFLGPGWSPAPEGVWDRIAGSLDENPPALALPANVTPLRPHRRAGLRVGAAAVAAAVVAVFGVLSLKVVDQDRRLEQMEQAAPGTDLSRAISQARNDASTRRVEMRATDGHLVAEALVQRDGIGYVVPAGLPAVGPDRTYQLWAVVGDDKISLGLLGSSPARSVFRTSGEVSALAITEEAAGGVVTSDQQPVAVGTVA